MQKKRSKKNKLRLVTTRLFDVDVDTLKQLGESSGNGWQIELRQIVRKSLVERREVMALKEQK